MDLEEIEIQLKEKLGDKNFKRAQLISQNKFGHKTNLVEKYYKSLLEGYLDIRDEWSDEYVVDMLKNRFDKSSNKAELLQEIIDTYDLKDEKTRQILDKYLRAIRNNKI